MLMIFSLLSLTTGQLFTMQVGAELENELNFDQYLLNMSNLIMAHSLIRTGKRWFRLYIYREFL